MRISSWGSLKSSHQDTCSLTVESLSEESWASLHFSGNLSSGAGIDVRTLLQPQSNTNTMQSKNNRECNLFISTFQSLDNASCGFSKEALRAGRKPNVMPMSVEKINANKMALVIKIIFHSVTKIEKI